MNVELFFARTWIILAALLVVFVTSTSMVIAWHYVKVWKRGGFNDVSSNVWVALTVAVVLDLVMFALMDVGQAYLILTENWGAIVGICSTVLMPLLGYKAFTKVTTPKGSAESGPGPTPPAA